jgi:hypothetical protein
MSKIAVPNRVKSAVFVAGIATATALLVASVPASGVGAHPATAKRTLMFTTRLVSENLQPAIQNSRHAGYTFEYTDKLIRHGKQVGTDATTCMDTDSRGTECSWTIMLSGGELQMQGYALKTNRAIPFAIVGGTGAFAGASGEATITDNDKTVAHYRLVITTH